MLITVVMYSLLGVSCWLHMKGFVAVFATLSLMHSALDAWGYEQSRKGRTGA